VLLLSYLDKIGLSLTGEAGQASAYLYSEARLYIREPDWRVFLSRLPHTVNFEKGNKKHILLNKHQCARTWNFKFVIN
jgi:hypothetical protein